MANTTVVDKLRGLALSAADLRILTNWSDPVIEDYLSLVDNIINIAETVDGKNDLIKTVTVVDSSMSPYEIGAADEEVFFDTTLGDIVANLKPGVLGTNYRLINVGTADNKVTVNAFGTELIFNASSEYIYDEEALLITFDDTYGWH